MKPAKTSLEAVSILIINYNSGEYLGRCLNSIFRNQSGAEVIVWDNASSDESLILQRGVLDRIKLHRSSSNVGFSRAVNSGMALCSGKYILLLNPDTEVNPDFLVPIVDFISKRDRPCIVGGKVLNPNGSFEPACIRAIPTPGSAFTRLSGLARLFPASRRLPRYNLPDNRDTSPRKVGAISGSFCMFHKELCEEIRFDEEFFLFGEDLDFCFRAAKAGYEVWFLPTASVRHRKGVSMRIQPVSSVFHFYDSMLKFHRKHYSTGHSLAFNIMVFIGVWALAFPRIIGNIAASPVRLVKASLEG
ncbi:MAG: glycosyltransferase family 2 protein [Candidatus Coatesbacteria bacterium]|nr:glycosyltransferase family 2 protein [Candidatus Coatesbacteria bacterium]